MKPHRTEGIRRLGLAFGFVGSMIGHVWILFAIVQNECGFSVFIGLQECRVRPQDFSKVSFQRVLVSASFQALPHDQKIQWVHKQLLQEATTENKYFAMPVDEQYEAITTLLTIYRPNRVALASRYILVVCIVIGIGFLAPWGLVRLVAWILEGFRSDRLAS